MQGYSLTTIAEIVFFLLVFLWAVFNLPVVVAFGVAAAFVALFKLLVK